MSLRLNQYLRTARDVVHTTLNPYQSGAVRIHLIPPGRPKAGIPWVLILNGQDILPLNTSWAVLLAEFINEVNRHSGETLADALLEEVIGNAILNVQRVFPKAKKSMLRSDLRVIIKTIVNIGQGKPPNADTGYMTLARYAPNMRAPHRMDLMISSMRRNGNWHCNQQCLHCYAANQPLGETAELTTGEWKQVIDRCRDAWISQLTFTGGEPTLREDLPELVAHASWFVTRLNTNGVRLTAQLCRALAEASLDSVQITLYSHDPEIHNRLVGANQFYNTVEGIKNALAAGLNVSVNTPLCSLNTDYALTLRFAAALGVKYFSCSGLIPAGGALDTPSQGTRLDEDRMTNILKTAVMVCRETQLDLNFTSPGWVPNGFLRSLGLIPPACGACLSNMAVAPDGSVAPCQSWLSGDCLGNILKMDWNQIWNSGDCRRIREQAAKSKNVCLLSREVRK